MEIHVHVYTSIISVCVQVYMYMYIVRACTCTCTFLYMYLHILLHNVGKVALIKVGDGLRAILSGRLHWNIVIVVKIDASVDSPKQLTRRSNRGSTEWERDQVPC